MFVIPGTYNNVKKLGWRILPLFLALNYFCFRAEVFSEENEKNHPNVDHFLHQTTLSLPTLNWETFDKDNAPKAIRVEPWLLLQFLKFFDTPPCYSKEVATPFQPIRDKSPPSDPQP